MSTGLEFPMETLQGEMATCIFFKLREICIRYTHLVLTKIVKLSPGLDTLQCDTEGGDHLCLHIVQRLSQLDLSL